MSRKLTRSHLRSIDQSIASTSAQQTLVQPNTYPPRTIAQHSPLHPQINFNLLSSSAPTQQTRPMSQTIPQTLGHGPHPIDTITFTNSVGTTHVKHPLTTAELRGQWGHENYHLLDEMMRLLIKLYFNEREWKGHQTVLMRDRASSLIVIFEEILEYGFAVRVEEIRGRIYRSTVSNGSNGEGIHL
jgi:hypothetical protein